MTAQAAGPVVGAAASPSPTASGSKRRVVARAAVRYGSLDPVAVLTGYVVLATVMPAGLVVPALGGVGTPANVYALLVLLWYLVSWLGGQITPAPGTRAPRVAMCAFAAAVVLSYIAAAVRSPTSMELQAADRGLIQLAAWTGLIVVTSAGIRTYAGLARLLRRLVVCGSVMAVIGVVEFFTRTDIVSGISIPGLQHSAAPGQLMGRSDFVRPMSTAIHPLEFGAVMMMLLPFAIQQAFDPSRKGAWRKWAPVFLIGFAAPMTVSRTSIIGLIVVLVILIPTWSPERRWPALGVLIVSFGVVKVATPGLIGTLTGLFSAMFKGGDSSTQARTGDYADIARYVSERPWTGRGFGTFIPSLYRFTDNMYLLITVEMGFLGAVALLILGVTMMHCGGAGRRRYAEPSRRELGHSFVAAAAVALISSATFDTIGFPMFGGVFFLLVGCAGAYLGTARFAQQTELPVTPGAAGRLR